MGGVFPRRDWRLKRSREGCHLGLGGVLTWEGTRHIEEYREGRGRGVQGSLRDIRQEGRSALDCVRL